MHSKWSVIWAVFLWGASFSVAANEGGAPDIRTEMTVEERAATGVDKLTGAELAALQQWLAGREERLAARLREEERAARQARARASFGRPSMKPEERGGPTPDDPPGEIAARIPGRFEGFDGGTVVTLDNGQRWQQIDGDKYIIFGTDLQVTIREGLLGAYYLNVVGKGRQIKVRRVR